MSCAEGEHKGVALAFGIAWCVRCGGVHVDGGDGWNMPTESVDPPTAGDAVADMVPCRHTDWLLGYEVCRDCGARHSETHTDWLPDDTCRDCGAKNAGD